MWTTTILPLNHIVQAAEEPAEEQPTWKIRLLSINRMKRVVRVTSGYCNPDDGPVNSILKSNVFVFEASLVLRKRPMRRSAGFHVVSEQPVLCWSGSPLP